MPAAAIVGAAAIGAGASMVAADKQASGAEHAAGLQHEATLAGIEEQRRQFDLTRADFGPYRETGRVALEQYGALYGIGEDGLLDDDEMEEARARFKTTPGYDFRFDEGMKALDRSAAARGALRGGGHERELIRYGQGVASGEFENYANRLASIAGIGQQATGQGAAIGGQIAGNIAGIAQSGAAAQGLAAQNAATARASGYAGVGQAAQGAASNYILLNALK
ncbi:MAG: hypothetical protein ACPG4X_14715 [Pikeienuella sp.]